MRRRRKAVGEFKTELVIQKKILKEVLKMAKTQAELNEAITAIGTAVEADVEQDKEVVRLARILIDKIKTLPNAADFEVEVQKLAEATAKLSSDNADVQTALDEAGTV